ncbi:MAG: tetratricopeptide repeat protein [Lysobacterales bacterium]
MSFFDELKRRNVFKVAAAYIIVSWLIMQAGDTLAPALHLPEWVNSVLAFFLILGFPLALFFAWAYEMTPEGLKKEKDVDRSQSITGVTGQKLNNLIIGVMVLALAYFAIDKFALEPGRSAEEIASAVQNAQRQPTPPIETAEPDNSIAVLPFVNMSSDQEQEYFSDGLSEELLNLLAKIPELRVAARTSSFSFKGKNLEIPEIASRLKVAHVLEGSVRKSGDQIRITAQLVRADNGYHLWSETYDRTLDNIFQIQDEIAVAVVDALKITLLGEAPKARETDPKAYQLYLEGQYISRQISAPTLPRAIELLKSAVEIDPNYAPAWAELAYAYMYNSAIGDMSIEEGAALADKAIQRALETDPDYAWTYFVRGVKNVYNNFEFKAGAGDYQRALQLDPGNAFLIGANGNVARVLGRLDDAISLLTRALALDPLIPEVRTIQGLTYYYAGRLDEAETSYRSALTLSPEYSGGHYRLGRVLLSQGKPAEALAEMKLENSPVYRTTGLAMAYHALGDHEAARSALDDLIESSADSGAYQIAEIYGFRNENDEAFQWLDRAVEIRDSGIASVLGDPALRGLITDPRWPVFLEKLGLLEFWLGMPPEWGGPQQ